MKMRLQILLSALAVFASYGVAHASEENCEVLKGFFSETRPKDANFSNAINYIFVDPFIVMKYRALPFVYSKPILSAYNFYYFLLLL